MTKALDNLRNWLMAGFQESESEVRLFVESILRSYAIIFFSQNLLLGAVLLGVTLFAPSFGLLGLAGLMVCYGAARLLGFERSSIQSGVYLFNSLLVSLALAYLNNFQKLEFSTLLMLLVSASMITLFVSVVMFDIFARHYTLPALSLPFVGVAFALFFLFYSFNSMPITSEAPAYIFPEIGHLPDGVVGFFQSLGAIFFLPHVTVGVVVFICVAAWSRLAVLYAVVGYTSGVLLMKALGMDVVSSSLGFVGFNFIFCAIALGGIFLVPSRGSLLMVVLGSFFCVVVAVAVKTFLKYFGIPPLALPLSLVILLVLYSMKCRTRVTHLFCSPFEPERPERNFRRFFSDTRRFPDLLQPHLHLPFFGERTVTQSFHGKVTHCGDWGEAFDFEILDEAGNRFMHEPVDLAGNHVFDTPVLAPCNGMVVNVVADVRDNEIGKMNSDRNWGNAIVIQDDLGYFVKLCHLKKDSILVVEGVRVAQGQVIARCGNTGRSPVPHLHMQVQRTAQVGDKTIPFRLAQYCTKVGDRLQYHTSGIPEKDATLLPVEFSDRMAACFEFGEATWEYDFNGRSETIRCELNSQGDYVMTAPTAKLIARIKDRTFYTIDYQGGIESVLFFIHIGLCRAPFISADTVFWKDQVDLRSLLRPGVAAVLDFVGPFVGYPLAQVECSVVHNEAGGVRVCTSVDYPVPRRLLRKGCPEKIEISLSTEGIDEIRAFEGGVKVLIEKKDK